MSPRFTCIIPEDLRGQAGVFSVCGVFVDD